jgi:hypothetical protein
VKKNCNERSLPALVDVASTDQQECSMRVTSLFGVLLMAGALLAPVQVMAQGSGAGGSSASGGSAGGAPDQSKRAAKRDGDTMKSDGMRGRRHAEGGERMMHRSKHRRGETRVSVSERDRGWRHRHRRHAHAYVSVEERRYGHHRHGYRSVRAERDHDDCR